MIDIREKRLKFFYAIYGNRRFSLCKAIRYVVWRAFYDLTWNNGLSHEQSDVKIPCIYLHAKESLADNGVYLCAASREQAERTVTLIGDNCQLIETNDSNHNIHGTHKKIYLDAINSFL